MPNTRLSESRIEALKPHKAPYDIGDRELKGFGVRVLPSGVKRFSVHSRHDGRRLWRTISDAGVMDLDEARQRARKALAAIRHGEGPALPEERLFEAVAEEVFSRYGRSWKSGPLKVSRNYLRSKILPWFGGMNIRDRCLLRGPAQLWLQCGYRQRFPDPGPDADSLHCLYLRCPAGRRRGHGRSDAVLAIDLWNLGLLGQLLRGKPASPNQPTRHVRLYMGAELPLGAVRIAGPLRLHSPDRGWRLQRPGLLNAGNRWRRDGEPSCEPHRSGSSRDERDTGWAGASHR